MSEIRFVMFVLLVTAMTSCVSMLPVNNHYEKAGTLQQGNFEVSGHITRYDVRHFERTEASNRNFGFRAGYGLSDRWDLKLRYERMKFTPHFDNRLVAAHHFSLTPKFAVVPEYFSLLLGLGNYYTNVNSSGNEYRQTIRSISPQMIFSITNRKKQLDLSMSGKLDFLFESGGAQESNAVFGATMGAGFSRDLRRWAIRPEIGLATSGDDAVYFSYGIGFQWIFNLKGR